MDVDTFSRYLRSITPAPLNIIYRKTKKWYAPVSAKVADAPHEADVTREAIMQRCKELYFKIWHDDGVMHLFTIDCISPKYWSVCDVGCGTALDAPLIGYRNPHSHYTGIDANEIAIAIARETLPHCRLIAGDFMAINISQERYDFVMCLSVLEHTIDFEKMIRKLVSCARYEVVLGFYRGLTQNPEHSIQPVRMGDIWEPMYGNGLKNWDFSYLNTYSEIKLRNWLLNAFPDWEVTFNRLHNPILKEFPRPVMARLRHKTWSQSAR